MSTPGAFEDSIHEYLDTHFTATWTVTSTDSIQAQASSNARLSTTIDLFFRSEEVVVERISHPALQLDILGRLSCRNGQWCQVVLS